MIERRPAGHGSSGSLLIASRSRSARLTCHVFRHHPAADGIPLLTRELRQALIGHGEPLSRRCANRTGDMVRSCGSSPEAP